MTSSQGAFHYIAGTYPKQERRPLELKNRTVGLLVVLFLLLSLIGWFYLTQASEATTIALRFQRLVMEREDLRRQNAELRYEIAEQESLSQIKERARQLGLGPPEERYYLQVTGYVKGDWESLYPSVPAKEEKPAGERGGLFSYFPLFFTGQWP